MSQQWYYNEGGQKKGPLSAKQLRDLAITGVITPETLVWTQGLSDWRDARRVKGLFPSAPVSASKSPPPLPSPEDVPAERRKEPATEDSSFRSQLVTGGKYVGAIGMLSGLAGDFLEPLAPINKYLFALATLLTAGLSIQWLRLSPEVRRQWERRIPHQALVACVVLLLAFGFWFFAQMLSGGESEGLLASHIGPIRELQHSLLKIGTDVTAIKQDTTEILTETKKISENVDGITKLGGLIKNPATPADYYHNARIHELSGDFTAAFSDYKHYVTFGQEFVDPYLSYLQLLRSQRGQQAASREFEGLKNSSPSNLALEFATFRLLAGEDRRNALERLSNQHPEFAPALLDLANYYSAEEMPSRSGVDAEKEQEWLERFLSSADQGGFVRFYLDKKQAEETLEAARGRANKASTTGAVLEADKKVFLANTSEVWVMDNTAAVIEYSFDQSEWKPVSKFVKTAILSRGEIDDRRIFDKSGTVYVRYADQRGKTSKVYKKGISSVDARSAPPGLGQPR